MKTIKTMTAQEFADGFREYLKEKSKFLSEINLDRYIESITPKPIFVNSLNQEFFEGDEGWWVYKKTFNIDLCIIKSNVNANCGESDNCSELFKTEADCEKWISDNRPKFSIQDVTDLLSNLQLSPDQIQKSIKTLNK